MPNKFAKARLLSFCNSLVLQQVRLAKVELQCQLCTHKIQPGTEYRGDRAERRAHNDCIAAVLASYRSRPAKKEAAGV